MRISRHTLLCLLAAAGLAAGLSFYLRVPRQLFPEGCSTLLYSADGQLLGARIAPDGQWRFPPGDTLPPKFVTALLNYEDKRFYYHPGVDPAAVGRAAVSNLRAGKIRSGGSTLTMQLARLARKGQPRTFPQKLIETAWAFALEIRYSKAELLALYAANAPFGGNVVGVETAAWRYFGRHASDLSWAESATLAVLPNAPRLIHPGRNRDALKAKRDGLLALLHTRGVLDRTTYELACLEPLPDAPLRLPDEAPHLMERLAAETPGRRITTSVGRGLQQQVQRIVDRYAAEYRSNHIRNLAAVVADVETGEVLAYAGNARWDGKQREGRQAVGKQAGVKQAEAGSQVDIITAPRSTGSILKPFLYAAMLDDGQLLPSMLVSDVPLNINGFTPQNYNKTFHGAVAAHVALERSLNVPLVRMLSQYNTGRFLSLLKSLGMTTLRFSEDHYGASLILGGAEGTLWDLTGMYASLSRTLGHYRAYNGRYDPGDIHPLRLRREGSGPTKAKKQPVPDRQPDAAGRPVQNRQPDGKRRTEQNGQHGQPNGKQQPERKRPARNIQPDENAGPIRSVADPRLTDRGLLSAAAVWFTYEAMSALNRPEEEADWQQFESMKKIAWKTGTSYGGRDAWAIGTTPRYVVGVWAGNASGEGRPGLTGVGNAAPVMFDIFSLLPGSSWFDMPYDELEPAAICRASGHKASAFCETTDSTYIPRSGLATAVCPYHKQVHLSEDGRYRVNASCYPAARIRTCSWFVLPPAEEYYYRNYHLDYRPLPPLRPGCEQTAAHPIGLIYPEHNAVLFLPKGFSGQPEKFVFKAAHARPDAVLYWHLDETYLGETCGMHQMACRIAPGSHYLTLVDDEGNRRKIRFDVK